MHGGPPSWAASRGIRHWTESDTGISLVASATPLIRPWLIKGRLIKLASHKSGPGKMRLPTPIITSATLL